MGKMSAIRGAAALAMAYFAMVGAAQSVELCSCCAAQLSESCAAACAPIPKIPGQCTATVAFEGRSSETERNPLNGLSLSDLSLGNPTASQAELFRRFLERNRRAAVRTYLVADKRYRRGKIDKAEMDAAQALYDEALVNYQHGIRAYLNFIGKKSD